MSANRSIVDRAHEAFNARRFEDLAQLLDDSVLMVIEGTSLRGRTAVRDYLAGFVRQIPGLRVELERVLADSGDTIVTLTRSVDTSPATSGQAARDPRPLLITTQGVVHRIVGGRIVEWRHYLDAAPGDGASGDGPVRLAGIHQLVGEQEALRRVATLVARGAVQSEVFDAIVSEASELFGEEAWLVRFDTNGTGSVLAPRGAISLPELTAFDLSGDGSLGRVRRSGRPDRVDSYAGATGPGTKLARRFGIVASAAAPLVLQGTPWGALALASRGAPLAVGIEERLAQFADLASTAIANAQSRAELESLADEQAALRRVAELVARSAGTHEVFDQVTAEASRLLADAPTALWRLEPSDEAVIIAQCGDARAVGARILGVTDDPGFGRVMRTRRPLRIDDLADLLPAHSLPAGVRGAVGAPIVVAGQVWGVLGAYSRNEPLPAGTEDRLARFCELVSAAIANAKYRAALTASRARIVASADEARRRLARDVHDGAQQRLVHALLRLGQAQAALEASESAPARLLEEALVQVQAANAQLRELAHGILPAALARGGLHDGVQSLLRHTPLPVDAQVLAERLPEPVETTAYFVIAEALTNIVKHAGADRARVRALADGDRLEIEVFDDGRGGADPDGGSGLTGLIDSIEAVGGSMSVSSPPGEGTNLSITLPIEPSETPERQSRAAVTPGLRE